jgi:hypothetical protein
MKFVMLLASLFLTFALSSCTTMEIADISPGVTLPASQGCFRISVLTLKEQELPELECIELKKRSLFITSEDWKKQRIAIQKNCQMQQCKQLVGAFDQLFLTIDKALLKLPL